MGTFSGPSSDLLRILFEFFRTRSDANPIQLRQNVKFDSYYSKVNIELETGLNENYECALYSGPHVNLFWEWKFTENDIVDFCIVFLFISLFCLFLNFINLKNHNNEANLFYHHPLSDFIADFIWPETGPKIKF